MSGGLRYGSTTSMPPGMRAMVERAIGQAERVASAGRAATGSTHPSEHEEACSLMTLVRSYESEYPALELFYAIPNGGDRHKAVAGKMRAEGQRPGVPDYSLPVARGTYHGLYIELKSLTGSPSREQKAWIIRLRAEGYRAEVARGAAQAWQILCEYLGITP